MIDTEQAVVALEAGDHLGEGPVWLVDEGRLLRVDITAGEIHSWAPEAVEQQTRHVGGPVSFAIPRRGGGLVIGRRHTVEVLDGDERRVLTTVESGLDHNRFNDAKCDALGRLWAGTMSTRRESGVAALYRIEPDGAVEPAIEGTTISNGLDWSPDGARMYFVDSPTQRVDVFDFDLGAGRLDNRRPLIEIPASDGLPDGLTVDRDGGIWIALFGGGAVRRYADDGTLEAVVEVPTSNPTCPTFGGSDLEVLFVTSARHRLTAEQLREQPCAGAIFAVRPGISGRPAHRFAG